MPDSSRTKYGRVLELANSHYAGIVRILEAMLCVEVGRIHLHLPLETVAVLCGGCCGNSSHLLFLERRTGNLPLLWVGTAWPSHGFGSLPKKTPRSSSFSLNGRQTSTARNANSDVLGEGGLSSEKFSQYFLSRRGSFSALHPPPPPRLHPSCQDSPISHEALIICLQPYRLPRLQYS